MSRAHLIRVLFVLAAVCLVATVLTTEHVLSAAASGLALGYCLGLYSNGTTEG